MNMNSDKSVQTNCRIQNRRRSYSDGGAEARNLLLFESFAEMFFALVSHEQISDRKADDEQQYSDNEIRDGDAVGAPIGIDRIDIRIEEDRDDRAERQTDDRKIRRRSRLCEYDVEQFGKRHESDDEAEHHTDVDEQDHGIALPIVEMDGVHDGRKIPESHKYSGRAESGHDLRDRDDVAYEHEHDIVVPLQAFDRARTFGGKGSCDRYRDGHYQPDEEQRDTRRALLGALDLVGDGGESADHHTAEQTDHCKRRDFHQLLNGKKAEQKSRDRAHEYGQQKFDAIDEASEHVAEGINELVVQFEYDRNRGSADPGSDDRKTDEKTEQAAFGDLFAVFVTEIGLTIVREPIAYPIGGTVLNIFFHNHHKYNTHGTQKQGNARYCMCAAGRRCRKKQNARSPARNLSQIKAKRRYFSWTCFAVICSGTSSYS